jgi:CMP-N,N'-diacetyllegionaminic acid synthase
MAFSGHTVLAVVPARGGSKGIPRKNLARVGGKTLIEHAAGVVKALSWIDAAVLSTDDEEIAVEGLRCGLPVPFRRPAELAADTAGAVEMWRHAWLECERLHGHRFDLSILLEPTSPLRKPEDVEHTLSALVGKGHAAAVTVSRVPAHYAPEKTLLIQQGVIGFTVPAGARIRQRQQLPAYYHQNGACYAVRRATLVDQGHLIDHDCAAVIIERPLVNIDEPLDLELAEHLAARAQVL